MFTVQESNSLLNSSCLNILFYVTLAVQLNKGHGNALMWAINTKGCPYIYIPLIILKSNEQI